jgi:hypothetical protein
VDASYVSLTMRHGAGFAPASILNARCSFVSVVATPEPFDTARQFRPRTSIRYPQLYHIDYHCRRNLN